MTFELQMARQKFIYHGSELIFFRRGQEKHCQNFRK